ncbi:MAG: hypothetical protein M3081_08370 [Gemmatimonadota bacterium]|nr:hypothetical protein [Gemmatimonadota bacterium]
MKDRIGRIVLVIAADAVIGAFLGILVELAGDRPRFGAHRESVGDAIRRVKAPVVLLDCDHDAACEDHAYAAAEEVGSEIVVFGHEDDRERIERMANERDVYQMSLPIAPTELVRLLDEVLAA